MAISNIAHDIRTPLTIASGYTQQLINLLKINRNLTKIAQHLDFSFQTFGGSPRIPSVDGRGCQTETGRSGSFRLLLPKRL